MCERSSTRSTWKATYWPRGLETTTLAFGSQQLLARAFWNLNGTFSVFDMNLLARFRPSEISSVSSTRNTFASSRWRPNPPMQTTTSPATQSNVNFLICPATKTAEVKVSDSSSTQQLFPVLQQRHSSSSIMHLLLLARSLPTESVVSTLIAVKALGDSWFEVIQPRSVYAVMRVLEERPDLKTHISEPRVLAGICSLLSNMLARGLNPVCRVITGICFDVASEPTVRTRNDDAHVQIIAYLSAMPLNASEKALSLQGSSTMIMRIRKMTLNMSELLSQDNSTDSLSHEIKALSTLVSKQQSHLELERMTGGERGAADYSSLQDSFSDLLEASTRLIPLLGPDTATSLLNASASLAIQIEWNIVKRVLSSFVNASGSSEKDFRMWGKALALALASFGYNGDKGDSEVELGLTSALEATLSVRGEGMTFVGYLTEQIYQRHSNGSRTPIAILLAKCSLGLSTTSRNAAGYADLVAATCRTLVDSQPAHASIDSSSHFWTTLHSSLDLVSLSIDRLSMQGLCDGLISACSAPGQRTSVLQDLSSQILSKPLTSMTLPPRTMVAVTAATITADDSSSFLPLRLACFTALSQLPIERLERALSPARKIQLLDAVVKTATKKEVNESATLSEVNLLQSCIQCIQNTTHLLSPSQSVRILEVLSQMNGAGSLSDLKPLLTRIGLHLNSRTSACSIEELISSCKHMAMLHFHPGLLLSSTLSRVILDFASVSNSSLVWLAWSLAKLNCKKPQSNAIIKECLDRATRLNGLQLDSSQLAVVIWVCGRLSYRNDKLLKPVLLQLVKGSSSSSEAGTGSLSMRLVANVIWSCAKLGFSTELLASWSVRQLGPKLELLMSCPHPQTICNLAWGLWRLGHRPQTPALHAFVAAAERCIGSLWDMSASSLKPTELAALLSALSGWKAKPGQSFFISVEEAMQRALSSRDEAMASRWPADVLIGCAWSIVDMGYSLSQETLEGMVQMTSSTLTHPSSSISNASVCNLLWVCHSSNLHPELLLMAYTSNLLQQMAGLSGLLGYPRVRSKADEIVKTLRPSFSGADLAEISNAIGLFKWEDSHLCNLLETAAMRTEIESSYLFKPSARDQQPDSGSSHRKTMTPAQLSKFLHGLSLLNHCPRRWLERGLPRALRASIPEMELKELSRCIAAIGCWKDEMDLSVRRHLIYQCISPALDALEKDIPSASTPALLTLLSGLSHLGLYQQKIVEAIALKLAHPNILLKLENQDLTSLLLSLAHQKHYDKQLMDDITIEFQRRAVRGNGVKQLRLKDVVGFLWSSSKFNRKLKADVLDSLSTLSLFSIDDSFQDLVTIAYSLAIMRQHVSTLASQVAMAIVEKLSSLPIQELDSHQLPSSARQLDQVAAVLLAAQAEGVQSPLAHLLLPEIQEMAMEHWKRRTALKSLKRPNRYLHEVAAALKRIGYDARLGSMTSDQLVAPDVLVTVPSVSQVAIEMVGKHNAAGNSPSTILGDAVLKYRLLQSRGIVVLAVNCNEWDMQEKINKTLYIEEKLTGLKS